MGYSARLYNCALCRQQVVICSSCDRGNIYCGSTCSRSSRARSLRRSNQTYQKTFRGKQQHAKRQSCYRLRQNKKSDVSAFPVLLSNDLLPPKQNKNSTQIKVCHFCGNSCSEFIRHEFLREGLDNKLRRSLFWPQGP